MSPGLAHRALTCLRAGRLSKVALRLCPVYPSMSCELIHQPFKVALTLSEKAAMTAKPCDERERLKEELRGAMLDFVAQVGATKTAAGIGKPHEFVAQQKREQTAEKVRWRRYTWHGRSC